MKKILSYILFLAFAQNSESMFNYNELLYDNYYEDDKEGEEIETKEKLNPTAHPIVISAVEKVRAQNINPSLKNKTKEQAKITGIDYRPLFEEPYEIDEELEKDPWFVDFLLSAEKQKESK